MPINSQGRGSRIAPATSGATGGLNGRDGGGGKMKGGSGQPGRRVLLVATFLIACASPVVSQAILCSGGDAAIPQGSGPQPDAKRSLLRASVPADRSLEHVGLEDLVDLAALDGLRVRLVNRLPPGKTGMTTGEGKDVRVFVSRRYPLFIQYSTLVHELVHARDRQQGIHRHLSRDRRELRAFAAELSRENVRVLQFLTCRRGLDGEHMLEDFLNDVATHYWQHQRRVVRETGRRHAGEIRRVRGPASVSGRLLLPAR
jgi:hypothetical protein